ncbi:peptidase inhibitor family I36 protein, partial [Streptomyces lycii]|uniref:peptidase inhibitor family I36 protein n=1 Tax=Streptomyces lycii TaxID=2654337 RepID=UPI001F26B3F3
PAGSTDAAAAPAPAGSAGSAAHGASAGPAGSTDAAAAPAPAGSAGSAAAAPSAGACSAGQLCLWERPRYGGPRTVHELAGTDVDSCVPLPSGTSAQALANRTGRPVTTYQSAECGETGEFDTYPGGGTWVPQTPYRVRAFKIWER